MTHRTSTRGFTLVETLIATGMLVTAIAGLAHLFSLSVRFTRDSGQFGAALIAAQDKLESLRALGFTYDEGGTAVTDVRLVASPSTTLREDIEPYFDRLDASGNVVMEGASYIRRWRISSIAPDEPAAVAIDVCVFDVAGARSDPVQAEACVGTVRVRQP